MVQQARKDRAPRGARERALLGVASLSAGAGVTASAHLAWGASATSKVTPWLVAKWIGVGMTATLTTFMAAEGIHDALDADKPSSTAPKSAAPPAALDPARSAVRATAPAASAAAPMPLASTPLTAEAAAVALAAPTRTGAVPSSFPGAPSSTAFDSVGNPASSAELAREVARLRGARASLVAGEPARALQALDAYGQLFPKGALQAEAAALRVEAVAMQGDGARARRLASEFATRFPSSPLAPRVRAVSGLTGESEPKP